jgi:plasmid stabilization system protein ParE
VTDRRVRFTATAEEHVDREHLWWRENRDYQELFRSELDLAVRLIAVMPGAGSDYTPAGIPGLRRLYLRRISCHLYYTFDDHEVIVHALWGARRERGPFPL